ncbi:flavodoxin domain-containing protein [Marinobacterium arenosum]|uniref:flavodoxin domain-containing protein n=1 Tax=Marinobacterium arenosum TaxID=2862496 RepID=UPI001C939A6F|nr:flavodoxin domain-containing protein [Marinobacterium arenosum]MBY4677157.1 flavodoxin domain-containing protein [Marinobacterium arenosum]
MTDIAILVGTESGNAQMVADALQEVLEEQGHEVTLFEEPDVEEIDFPNRDVVIISCSTHGDGELPDNIIPMCDALKEQKPDLSHIRYGVVALGDQTYHQTFCQAGKDVDAIFASCGAVRVGERFEVDACTQPLPDEDAREWAKEWLEQL